jgi:hypothetical protein
MTIVECAVFPLILIMVLVLFWLAFCQHRTVQHRQEMIATGVMHPELMIDIGRVSFDRHFWFVFFGRDYRRLYAATTWRANGWTRR